MSRVHSCLAVCLCALVIGRESAVERASAADPVAGTDLTAARRVSREAESRLLAGLHKQVKAEWENTPLEEVLATLAKTAGVSLWIDRESLTADGISTDEMQVTLNLGTATVWQALHFLLKPHALAWHGSDGVLTITTQPKLDENFVTRTYDVQAIVAALEPQLKKLPPRLRANMGGSGGGYCGSGPGGSSGGGGNSGGASFFSVPDGAESESVPAFVLPQFGGGGYGPAGHAGAGILISNQSMNGEELLVELLVNHVGAKWEQAHGEGGSISIGRGRLIVRQDFQTHFQIRELLQAVEEFVVRGTKVKSILIARPGYPHEEDAAIFKWLAEPQDINVTDAPVNETLAQLAKDRGYRLWIDKESLVADGIDHDTSVTLKLSGVALDAVLHKLLEPLALTFLIEEGTLVVTTMVKTDEMKSMRICFTGDIPEAHTASDLLTAIAEATSGKWEDSDGEGGSLWKAVPEWLVITQSQKCHREVAELLDDLRQGAVVNDELAAPELELRLYPVADETATQDLIGSLPTLVTNWDAKHGSIVTLGRSLAIKQPARVHERLDEIFAALNQAHARLNPPKPKAEPTPKVEPKPAAPVPVEK
ncbi:MAG: hypothetical protein NTZ32_19290 [Planctomycetales bacterium]|nr:hypothetical protein [Planctomycetales bacterium]